MAFAGSAVALGPLPLTGETPWGASTGGIVVALWLGLMAAAIPYALYAWGLAAVPAHRALTLTLAEPLTAVALGIVLLNEDLAPPGSRGCSSSRAGS